MEKQLRFHRIGTAQKLKIRNPWPTHEVDVISGKPGNRSELEK